MKPTSDETNSMSLQFKFQYGIILQ